MLLSELFSFTELAEARAARHVRSQRHPDPAIPLEILNYTERAVYENAWTRVTRQCRGLIFCYDSGTVIARPFPKFFNVGQEEAFIPGPDAEVLVTDKLDGSLGILYPMRGTYAIATRGSFTSSQALHATRIWQERYADLTPQVPELTYLFEIVYPENRVVIDYGNLDDLVELAILNTTTGRQLPPHVQTGWPGPSAELLPYSTFADVLKAEPRESAEGVVVYFPQVNERLKLKQDDYIELHRVITGLTERRIWEVEAVTDLAPAYTPKQIGQFLRLDLSVVERILAGGSYDGIPDEFLGWLDEVRGRLVDDVDDLDRDVNDEHQLVYNSFLPETPTRKQFAQEIRNHAYEHELFAFESGKKYTHLLWKRVRPESGLVPTRTEVAA